MNVMVGDNRLENAAVRLSDEKKRETHIAGKQQAQEELEEQAKKVSGNGVVLELNSAEGNESNVGQMKTEALDRVQNDTRGQQQEKTEYFTLDNEQRKATDMQRILENINI